MLPALHATNDLGYRFSLPSSSVMTGNEYYNAQSDGIHIFTAQMRVSSMPKIYLGSFSCFLFDGFCTTTLRPQIDGATFSTTNNFRIQAA